MESLHVLKQPSCHVFRLEVKVKKQMKTGDTDRYKTYVFDACVYQVHVNTLKTILEQWLQLQVAKCLIGHVLSSGYNVPGL